MSPISSLSLLRPVIKTCASNEQQQQQQQEEEEEEQEAVVRNMGESKKVPGGIFEGAGGRLRTGRLRIRSPMGSDRNSPSPYNYCYSKTNVVKAYERQLVGTSSYILRVSFMQYLISDCQGIRTGTKITSLSIGNVTSANNQTSCNLLYQLLLTGRESFIPSLLSTTIAFV